MRTSLELKGLVDLCCYVRERAGGDLTVVEIGSFLGESSLELALHFAKVYCVDLWDYPTAIERVTEKNRGEIEGYFDRVAAYVGNITKIKGESTAAAKSWAGPPIDLLYVDGDHRYDGVKADLLAWKVHVKPGGFLAGHDYGGRFEGVERAVREIVGEPEILFRDSSWAMRCES